jgi:hypothetical protein
MVSRVAVTTLTLAVITLLAAPPAEALKFELVNPKDLPSGVTTALWVRDCGPAFGDKQCGEDEDGFSVGDSVRLAQILSTRKFDEIWLASNGGVLDEGVAVGEVLRRFQATVRVPPGRNCISSCTVAFLGGAFRYIDSGATYQVHAASLFLSRQSDDRWLTEVVQNPQSALVDWSQRLLQGFDIRSNHLDGARESAQQLFLHFQKALHPLGQLPPGREDANRVVLRNWVRSAAPSRYGNSAQLQQDVAAVKREGVAAAQEILMRLERETMEVAISELRVLLPQLGPRAEPALKMLETMYSSRITGTASLSYETLLQMGYITRIFDPAKL